MSDPIIMLDSAGNPLSVGMAVLWKGHGRREFRPGWVRDIVIDYGTICARIDDGAEWDADLKGRTWSSTEWITESKRIRPRREQPKPDPRIVALTAEVERLRRILAVEAGDESAAPEGWSRNDNGHWAKGKYRVIRPGFWALCEVGDTTFVPFDFALQAMEAADHAGGSDV